MGIIDKVSALLPWRNERREPSRSDVLSLRDGLDRWFERFIDEAGGPPALAVRWLPAADVRERDDEVVVSVEVPGLEAKDLSLVIGPQGLIVRGERAEARDGERRYAAFVRTIPLPPGIDVDAGEARVRHGVLTVRFPKAHAGNGSRRIPVRT